MPSFSEVILLEDNLNGQVSRVTESLMGLLKDSVSRHYTKDLSRYRLYRNLLNKDRTKNANEGTV